MNDISRRQFEMFVGLQLLVQWDYGNDWEDST